MLKAIQTEYDGYLFRSRLEAKWAIFFNELGLEYQYEPDGYEFSDNTRYLPDFYLPQVSTSASALGGLWVEVKAKNNFGKEATDALRNLCNLTQHPGILVSGDPFENILLAEWKSDAAENGDAWWICGEVGCYEIGDPAEFDFIDGPYIFCVCPWCLKVGLEFDGRGARVCRYQAHYDDEESALNAIKNQGAYHRVDDKCYTGNHPVIFSAAKKARQGRFEFKNIKPGA